MDAQIRKSNLSPTKEFKQNFKHFFTTHLQQFYKVSGSYSCSSCKAAVVAKEMKHKQSRQVNSFYDLDFA